MGSFRRELLKAAESSNLPPLQLLRLRARTLFPRTLAEVESAVAVEAVLAGVVDQRQIVAGPGDDQHAFAAEIDWEALANFLKEIIPLIMEILMMFL